MPQGLHLRLEGTPLGVAWKERAPSKVLPSRVLELRL